MRKCAVRLRLWSAAIKGKKATDHCHGQVGRNGKKEGISKYAILLNRDEEASSQVWITAVVPKLYS